MSVFFSAFWGQGFPSFLRKATPQSATADSSPCTGEPKDEEKKEGWEISGQFSVDVVATPRVDLCGAAARDLNYREANGKFPMESRSQLAKEQEKLNSFLRYVNESFIIKGFSRASVQERANVRGFTSGNSAPILQRGTATELCDFDISHGDNAQLLVLCTITGDAAASGKEAAVLSVVLTENGAQVQKFQQAIGGWTTFSAPFLLINRAQGVTNLKVSVSVSGGEIYLDKYGAFASALVLD